MPSRPSIKALWAIRAPLRIPEFNGFGDILGNGSGLKEAGGRRIGGTDFSTASPQDELPGMLLKSKTFEQANQSLAL